MAGIEFLLILFFSSFLQAALGFGFGAVFIGLCAMMMPIDQVIMLSFVFAPAIQLILVLFTMKYRLSFDGIKLALLGLVGFPFGMLAFNNIDVGLLQILFGVFLILSSMIFLFGKLVLPSHCGVIFFN